MNAKTHVAETVSREMGDVFKRINNGVFDKTGAIDSIQGELIALAVYKALSDTLGKTANGERRFLERVFRFAKMEQAV